MRALFKSVNLIGDGINISPALRAWHEQHPEYKIDLTTLPDHAACLYSRMGVPVNVLDEGKHYMVTEPYNFSFNFDCGKAFQIGAQHNVQMAKAYAMSLGVEIKTTQPTYLPDPELEWLAAQPEKVILWSPFSRSCASQQGGTPNKMLPWPRWRAVLTVLQKLNLPIWMLGAPDDKLPDGMADVSVYSMCGMSLNRIALLMRDRAALLVTIDNGMAHLAASQSCPTFEYYPACLSDTWAMPSGNPNLRYTQIEPSTVPGAGVVWPLQRALPDLLAVRAVQSLG